MPPSRALPAWLLETCSSNSLISSQISIDLGSYILIRRLKSNLVKSYELHPDLYREVCEGRFLKFIIFYPYFRICSHLFGTDNKSEQNKYSSEARNHQSSLTLLTNHRHSYWQFQYSHKEVVLQASLINYCSPLQSNKHTINIIASRIASKSKISEVGTVLAHISNIYIQKQVSI